MQWHVFPVYVTHSLLLSISLYLMGLVPAILIAEPQLGSVVQEGLAAGGVAPYQHSVVKRCEPTAILIIRRCPQRQQRLQTKKKTDD